MKIGQCLELLKKEYFLPEDDVIYALSSRFMEKIKNDFSDRGGHPQTGWMVSFEENRAFLVNGNYRYEVPEREQLIKESENPYLTFWLDEVMKKDFASQRRTARLMEQKKKYLRERFLK